MDEMGRTYSTHGRYKNAHKIQSTKLNVREHLENPVVDGTLFKWRLQRGLDNPGGGVV